MRIVFLSDDFPPESFGGAGISTYELAKGVQKAGHEVSVITTCRKANEAGESFYDGLTIFKIWSDYHERWRAWRSLYNPPVVREAGRILEKLKPDVVHANNIHYHLSYHCLKLAKQYAKTVVITFRDTMAVTYGKLDTPRYLQTFDARISWLDNLRRARLRYNPFRNIVIKRYLTYTDEKFAVSRALARALEQNGIWGVTTIHTGIDANAWQASTESVIDFKKRHGLEHRKVILFGGRLSRGKGEAKAREALRLVREQVPDAVLLLVGGNAQKGGPGIVSTGWIAGEEKKAAYGASDVVWVPSVYLDPLPRMVLEGMAAGKPVIGTCYGGTPEIIADGETGYVVNPFDAQAIADKTIDLLQNPDKATAFGRAGRKRIKGDFNIDDKITKLIALYEEAGRKKRF